jgi:multiple sugar transport system permease protein/N-acetylglucosamine transport system permease protein
MTDNTNTVNKGAAKKRRIFKRKTKDTAFIIFMLSFAAAHFLIFWLYVNINTIVMSFMRFNTQTAQYEWYGFTRFANIFRDMIMGRDPLMVNSLKNSLCSFPVQNFIILPLSFIAAFYLFKKVPMSNMFRVIFFLPSIISIVVLTMSFRFMFHADFGPANKLVETLFGLKPDYFSSMSPTVMPMVFLFGVWAGLGYNIILINGAMGRIPKEILEYGRLDGVSLSREMFQIILPLVWPTISTLFILGSLAIFSFYLQPMLLVGSSGGYMGRGSTVALQVMYMVQNGSGNDAAATGLFFSVIGVPFVMLIKWIMGKITPDVDF